MDATIALFLDIENITTPKLCLEAIFKRLQGRGRVVSRKAYGNHNMLGKFRQQLQHFSIEIACYPGTSQGKNFADIKLAVDATELALLRPHIDTFVIVSGDSDYVPLVVKLQELNRQTIVIGRPDHTSQALLRICDEFWGLTSLVGAPTERTGSFTAAELFHRAVALLETPDQFFLAHRLGPLFRQLDADFNYRAYGFPKSGGLKKMLQALEMDGHCELSYTPSKQLMARVRNMAHPPQTADLLKPVAGERQLLFWDLSPTQEP